MSLFRLSSILFCLVIHYQATSRLFWRVEAFPCSLFLGRVYALSASPGAWTISIGSPSSPYYFNIMVDLIPYLYSTMWDCMSCCFSPFHILVVFEGYKGFVVSSRSRLSWKTLSTNAVNSGSLSKRIFVRLQKGCCSVILASSWFCSFSSSDTMSYMFWILSATFSICSSATLSLEFFSSFPL